jgi:hypothetical protein
MLYKFHRNNKFLFNLLLDSSLWFSNPKDFNDPFDMRFSSDLSFDEVLPKDILQLEVAKYAFSKLGIDEEQFLDQIDKEIEHVGFDPKELVNIFVYQMFQNMGMCCFSKTYDNILLWSHYAEGHTGVCIEFDQTELNKMEKTLFFDLDYSDDFPIAKEAIDLRKAFRKSECWKYEMEARLLHPNKGGVKFAKKSIKRIIFGAKTEVAEIKRIVEVVLSCGYEDIKFLKANIHPYQYKLTYTDIL